ncbi:MAG: GDSL-type esterase/lipase family protein [Deltaproteobacteria bacterium]|jgi:lysophospholipase L1-like esterase|nr:GDSL-type esterase/lipase family protein [Deltaproteobacteria bacterium]
MKIVCLGDSLTYGYEVRRSAVWTTLAGRESGALVLNRGVNGMMTSGMLERFRRDVLEERPDAALLMGGANDILFELDAAGAENNMADMARRAREAGIRPFIGIPAPFCPPVRKDWRSMADFPGAAPLYEAYIQRLYALSEENAYERADFYGAVLKHAAESGEDLRSLYHDGLHLNERGHRVFAACLVRTLREAGLVPPADEILSGGGAR